MTFDGLSKRNLQPNTPPTPCTTRAAFLPIPAPIRSRPPSDLRDNPFFTRARRKRIQHEAIPGTEGARAGGRRGVVNPSVSFPRDDSGRFRFFTQGDFSQFESVGSGGGGTRRHAPFSVAVARSVRDQFAFVRHSVSPHSFSASFLSATSLTPCLSPSLTD